MDVRGARPSPGIDERPGGYDSDSDHLILRHAPTMPVCLTGHAPLLLQPREGGLLTGRWVMVTQITPHHTAYLHLTPNSMANRVSHRSNKNCAQWGCQLGSFHHIILRTVTCSSGCSRDPVVRTNRVAEFVLGRAKGRGEKNHFPFAIFNLATPKVVVIYCILRYIKVNSLFMALMNNHVENPKPRCALAFPK